MIQEPEIFTKSLALSEVKYLLHTFAALYTRWGGQFSNFEDLGATLFVGLELRKSESK